MARARSLRSRKRSAAELNSVCTNQWLATFVSMIIRSRPTKASAKIVVAVTADLVVHLLARCGHGRGSNSVDFAYDLLTRRLCLFGKRLARKLLGRLSLAPRLFLEPRQNIVRDVPDNHAAHDRSPVISHDITRRQGGAMHQPAAFIARRTAWSSAPRKRERSCAREHRHCSPCSRRSREDAA